MKNTNTLIEKLMLNRAALIMKKFDNDLKELLHTELQKISGDRFGFSAGDLDKRLTV